MASLAEAVKQIAHETGISPETGRYLKRELVKGKVIPSGSRGPYARHVDARVVAIITTAIMMMTDITTATIDIPQIIQGIGKLDKGSDPTTYFMLNEGRDGTYTSFDSFIDVMTRAIEGHEDDPTDSIQALGIQFCRGEIRAWAERKRTGKIFFGIHELPSGILQEATIKSDVLDALRQIVNAPSTAKDGSKTVTPTQGQTGSASVVSSESPRDGNRDAPLVHRHNMHKDSKRREKKQALDSAKGSDSPSPNRLRTEREPPDGQHTRHRCLATAQP